MGMMALQERPRWLNLTNLTDREEEDILDKPIVPKGIFAPLWPQCSRGVRRGRRRMKPSSFVLPGKLSLHVHLPQAHSRPSLRLSLGHLPIPEFLSGQSPSSPPSLLLRVVHVLAGGEKDLVMRTAGSAPKSRKHTATFFINKVCSTVTSRPRIEGAVRKCEQNDNKQWHFWWHRWCFRF